MEHVGEAVLLLAVLLAAAAVGLAISGHRGGHG